MLRDQEADFILQNNKVVYPPVSTDGLELYYDVKGKKNSDLHKDKLLDMSGNDRHGELHNFSYKNLSGYQEDSELVFDGIDDKLVLPELDIPENNFTFMLNGNIISFSPDGTVKRVQDGEVIESKGFNLIRNGDFNDGLTGWKLVNVRHDSGNNFTFTGNLGYVYQNIPTRADDKVYIVYNGAMLTESGSLGIRLAKSTSGTDFPTSHLVATGGHAENMTGSAVINVQDNYEIIGFASYPSPGVIRSVELNSLRVINLTQLFGSGNEPSKEEMDTIIDRMGFIPNPQDILDRQEYTHNILGDMEDIIDDHTRDEQSGVEVFTDKADDSLVRVEVDGKSVGGGSGKNLFKDFPAIKNGFKYEHIDKPSEGGLSIHGNLISQKLVSSETYTISLNIRGSANMALYRISSSGNSALTLARSSDLSETEYRKITLTFTPHREELTAIYINTAWSPTAYTAWFEIEPNSLMLEKGETASAYEPPVPAPDYPIEIHSLNDFDVVSQKSEGGMINGIEVGGRNLILNTDFNGSPFRYDYDNKGGEGGLRLGSVLGFSEFPKQPYEYTISMNIRGVSERHIVLFMISSSTNRPLRLIYSSDLTEEFKKVTFTFKPHIEELSNLFIYTEYGADPYSAWFEIEPNSLKLEKGNKATDWTPAPEDISENDIHPLIDKINLSLSEPLRSVGDVKDRLFKDTDGLWKIERNLGESVITGEMLTYRYGLGAEGINTFHTSFSNAKLGYHTSISSHFKNVNGGWDRHDHGVGYSDHPSARSKYFFFPNSLTGIVSEDSAGEARTKVNNWLAKNPVIVVYQLENPTIETLDQELQDKLNNLRSFQDSNYVYTIINDSTGLPSHISENLKPTIHTEFLAKDHYKENRTVNNLLIWNRSLENEELLNQNKLFHGRFNMKSDTIEGEPINQTINLTQGGYVANTLSLEYTIEI